MDTGSAQNDRFLQMTETPIEKLVCQLAVPTIISMLISALYNMADTYFVGQVGTSATAAVGVVFSLMAIIQAIGFFFGHGSGNCISRMLGAQRTQDAAKMAATGFFSSFLCGTAIAVVGLIFLEPLARLLGATPTILPHACEYMRYILLGTPFMTGVFTLNNQLRFQGNAVYGMIGIISGAVLNVALDPLFIFVFDMGVGGAGLATMLSQAISCVLLFIGCMQKGGIPIKLSNFSLDPALYREIVRGGLPSLFRQGLASVSVMFLNHLSGNYGDAAIAAMSIVSRTVNFAGSVLIGFGQGFQPVCGFNYGAGRYDRVKKAFWFCVKSSFVALLLIAVTGFLFAPQVIAVFRRDDPEVIRIGALAFRLQCLSFPMTGWVVMSNMMLQTIGKTARASLLAVSRQGLFFLPALAILTPLLGLLGIQLCQTVADVASFALALPLTIGVLREMQNE